jgi:hypothetical protein
MRKFILALAIAAQPALAEHYSYYVVAVPSDAMLEMVTKESVPRPVESTQDGKHDWLVVRDDDQWSQKYIDNATDVVHMSGPMYRKLKKSCGRIAYACVKPLLAEQGHD